MQLAARPVWPQGQRCHQRDTAKKKDDIAGEESWYFLVKIDLVVGPLELAHHPQRAAQREQHPEKVPAPVRRARINQQACVGKERHKALRHVSKGG